MIIKNEKKKKKKKEREREVVKPSLIMFIIGEGGKLG